MFFKQKSTIIFRNYESFGYITDNRNFGYKQANDDGNDIGDKIVSQTGAVFLSVLGQKPQMLDCLAEKISMQFTSVSIETIKNDAREFYHLLELDGFISIFQRKRIHNPVKVQDAEWQSHRPTANRAVLRHFPRNRWR